MGHLKEEMEIKSCRKDSTRRARWREFGGAEWPRRENVAKGGALVYLLPGEGDRPTGW